MKKIILFGLTLILLVGVVSAITYNHDWKNPKHDGFNQKLELKLGSVSQETQVRMFNAMWLEKHDLQDASDREIFAFKKSTYGNYKGSIAKLDKHRFSKAAYKEDRGYDFQGSLSVKYQKGFHKSYRNTDCWN